jgi:hypothetical protein
MGYGLGWPAGAVIEPRPGAGARVRLRTVVRCVPWTAPGSSSRRANEPGQADQGVGGGRKGKGPSRSLEAAQAASGWAGDGLDPAEGLLDALSCPLAHGIARMAGGPAVEGGAAAAGILRDVRRDPTLAQLHDEVARIEAAVGAERGRQKRCQEPFLLPPPKSDRPIGQTPARDRRRPRLSGLSRVSARSASDHAA